MPRVYVARIDHIPRIDNIPRVYACKPITIMKVKVIDAPSRIRRSHLLSLLCMNISCERGGSNTIGWFDILFNGWLGDCE